MKVVSPELIEDKTILLRLDLDVPIENGKVADDFRLLAGMDTLGLCLEYGKSVIIMGHLGRPGGVEVPELSVKPIVDWLQEGYGHIELPKGKLHILENLRFESGEEECSLEFAKSLITHKGDDRDYIADFYVNDAFASHNKAASTTVLPTLLPHAAGLRMAEEVEILTQIREKPDRPLVAIMGGAKVEDKLPVIKSMAQFVDVVLVGGKLANELKADESLFNSLGANVMVAKMTEDGEDIAPETVEAWKNIIAGAKMIVWNGPLGKYEDPKNDKTLEVAKLVIASGAKTIIGGGDSLAAFSKWELLDKLSFVSTGGGAMLKFLETGTLDPIEALA